MSAPELRRISDYPQEVARRFPEREAAVLDVRRLSYAALADQVDRCARALLAHGVGKGDRVAMLSTPRPEFMIVLLACLRIGAVWVGLNPVHQLDEHRFILNDCRPRLLFAFRRLRGQDQRDLLLTLRRDLPFLERLVGLDGDCPDESWVGYGDFLRQGVTRSDHAFAAAVAAVRLEDPAIIVYTSGSTGRPKGAVLTHRNLSRCATVQLALAPAAPLRALCNLPISHTVSTSEIVSFALAGGGTVIFQERFAPEAVLAAIERERVTFLLQIPAMLQQILAAAAVRRYDTSSLQAVLFLGAPMSRRMIAELAALGGAVFTGWGLTEATTSATFTERGDDLDLLADTVGRPTAAFEVRIVDSEGTIVPAGEAGEIQVRGDCVMAGYYGLPDATALAIDPEGWLRSGDLGRFDENGRLRLVGRLKDMFKSGGYNVYPREVEIALESHPAVALAAVVAVPDPLYGEIGCAFLIRSPRATLDQAEIAAHCRARLGNYKIPKKFVIRDALPMLPLGKVDKAQLRAEALRLLGTSPGGHDAGPPARAERGPRKPSPDTPSSARAGSDP